jgi:hypothetical protein
MVHKRWNFSTDVVTGNITLKAKWIPDNPDGTEDIENLKINIYREGLTLKVDSKGVEIKFVEVFSINSVCIYKDTNTTNTLMINLPSNGYLRCERNNISSKKI